MSTQVKQSKGSSTSSFGVSARENHDSSKFYSTRMYKKLLMKENKNGNSIERVVPSEFLDRVFCKSSEHMSELPGNSVHLMVTSPPYNVTKEYDQDLTLKKYLALLKKVFKETYRVLAPGGRACVNVANLGRKPYIPLHSYIVTIMEDIGFLMRGEIIWLKGVKGSSSGTSTAWGSWMSAANPTLRDVHEYILVFSKESFGRIKEDRQNTIDKNEFLEFTKSVWTFPSESAKRIGHPAPFPIELPRRLIQLYTFKGDIVLDPFCGSGSTGVAAAVSGRYSIQYDTNKAYVIRATERMQESLNQSGEAKPDKIMNHNKKVAVKIGVRGRK